MALTEAISNLKISVDSNVNKLEHQEKLKHTVFVRNLAYTTESDALHRTMRKYGKIVSCILVTDPATKMSKGCGFVQFEEPEAVEAAIQAAESSKTACVCVLKAPMHVPPSPSQL